MMFGINNMSSNASEDLEDQIQAAKTYLLRSSGKSGLTMYDHLVDILTKVLDKKPENVVEILQEYSQNEKRTKYYHEKDCIQDKQEVSAEAILAHQQTQLFSRRDIEVPDVVGDREAEEEERLVLPDVTENAFYLEQAGVGLGREETFRIFLGLKQLTDTYQLKSCRFWGKILGIKRNYIIAEVEFKGAGPYQHEDEEELETGNTPKIQSPDVSSDAVEGIEEEDDIPRSEYKPPPMIPKEMNGEGCNSKVYYVCNDAGLPWHCLPQVTPQQIHVARQIRKLMTGDLEAPVVSYPPFPGDEANFLRAQIARISASTHISPQGYFIFEEDEDEEEEESRTAFVPNTEFEGIPVSDLCDSSLAFWVHHNQYILPQGRTSWFNPSGRDDDVEEEEDEDDDEKDEPDELEPEEGPPLLSPLSEDEEVNGMPAWTAVKSTSLVSQYAIAVVHSNLWPGAHAFAYEKKFDNIYIGFGLKYSAENYSPPAPPAAQDEYPSGPEITEAEDPTVEQERALKAAQEEALEAEEDEEESEDDDDED